MIPGFLSSFVRSQAGDNNQINGEKLNREWSNTFASRLG
jgi:hypothetical protein